MNREDLKEKICEISNSEFPLIDFFNDIDWLDDKRFNTEKAYEDIEKIYNVFMFYMNKCKKLETENQELKETLNKTKKMGLEIIEEKKQLSNELHKLNCYRNIELNEITKLKKALNILKENLGIEVKHCLYDKTDGGVADEWVIDCAVFNEYLTEEQYDILKQVFESVGDSDE